MLKQHQKHIKDVDNYSNEKLLVHNPRLSWK